MASQVAKNAGLATRFLNAFRAWYVNASGYRQLGLKADDLLDEDITEVSEAVSRLDDNEKYERIFRMKRAMDLSLKHNILPKDQWTKPEEDVHYLIPLVEMVKMEMAEKKKLDQM
ncbi:uncharacterized protein LOC135687717 [Rhopilema esculentum]|uniref:uncharacterized protein LOC135687717 n=1 Tax=Rhopilema esculentum TaxID=499914 RepID=UPI0031D94EF2|eukprot:gene6213-11622_t